MRTKLFFVATFFMAILTSRAEASVLLTAVPSGTTTTLVLSVEAPEMPINGVEGSIVLSPATRVVRVDTARSFLLLWPDAPMVAAGTITFSGIVPGGFRGSAVPGKGLGGAGEVLRVVVEGEHTGTRFEGALLMHDGEGTLFPVEALVHTGRADVGTNAVDTTPPLFTEVRLIPPSARTGDAGIIIFAGIDRESGISHAQVRVGDGAWRSAVSPSPVSPEDMQYDMRVRIFDGAGNYREAQVHGASSRVEPSPYAPLLFGGGVLLLTGLLYWRRWTRHTVASLR